MSKATEGLSKIIGIIVAQELNRIIPFEDFGISTVTKSTVCTDFNYVDIYVSSMKNKDDLRLFLRDNVYHIQQTVNKKIKRKYVPKIRFQVDTSIDFSHKLDDYLRLNPRKHWGDKIDKSISE